MAASWFTSLGSQMVRMFPAVNLTGAAREGLEGISRRIVEIISNNDAYWIKVLLPINEQAEIVYVTYRIEHELRIRIDGVKRGGETTGTTSYVVSGGRTQTQQVYPLSYFTISFDLPGPVLPAIRHHKFCDDGTFEIFLLKSRVLEGEAPPPAPSQEASLESAAPPDSIQEAEGAAPPPTPAPPAPILEAEEAAAPPTSSA